MVNLPAPTRFIGIHDPYDVTEAALGSTWTKLFRMMDWLPTDRQLRVLREMCPKMMLGGGEQGGKSALAAIILVLRYFLDLDAQKDVPSEEREYWIAGHERKKFDSEWEKVTAHFKKLNLYLSHDKKTDTINLVDGTKIKGILTADWMKIASFAPLGILFCEAGQGTEQAYRRLMTRAMHRNGWIVISGTFEGNVQPWYTTEFVKWSSGLEPNAKAFSMATWDNTTLYPGGIDDPRVRELESIMGKQMFRERAEGKPIAAPGLVFSTFDTSLHLAKLPQGADTMPVSPLYNPTEQVHIWEDPGFDHAHAILMAQFYGGILWIFDEIYVRGVPAPEIRQELTMRPWWGNPDKRVVCDPMYSTAHHGNYSAKEIWDRELGLTAHGTRHRVEAGIARVNDFWRRNPETGGPYILIDGTRCRGLLSELGVGSNPITGRYSPYVYETDAMGEKVGFKPIPQNDDACDALRNGIVDVFRFGGAPASDRFGGVGASVHVRGQGRVRGFRNAIDSGLRLV